MDVEAEESRWLIRNDVEETTNEHQWTRIRCSGSEVSQEDFCSLFGERFRRRSEAVKYLSLFVWIVSDTVGAY